MPSHHSIDSPDQRHITTAQIKKGLCTDCSIRIFLTTWLIAQFFVNCRNTVLNCAKLFVVITKSSKHLILSWILGYTVYVRSATQYHRNVYTLFLVLEMA